MSTDQKLEKFLKDVDEISEILQGLNSEDSSAQENAISRADQKLDMFKKTDNEDGIRTKTNRTLINKPSSSFTEPKSEMSQALKDLGNEAYAKGNYENAIQRYSEGLEKLRDMQVLYTNRAQAHIKLQQYQNAITDCEWALKCDGKCLKAYVHMAKAFLGLKKFEEARTWYQKIMDIDSSKMKLVKGYLNEVDFQERKDKEEQNALQELEAGAENAKSVIQLLQRLSKEDQIPLYYSGGIQLLADVVKGCTAQTLFRTSNGFSIIGENTVINRSLTTRQADPIDSDLCISVLTLWQAVCNGNEENQNLFITQSNIRKQIFTLLSSEIPDIQRMTLALLKMYSSTADGRLLLVKHLDPSKLLKRLLEYVTLMDGRAGEAMDILCSLTQEQRLNPYFRTVSSELLSSFTSLLRKLSTVNTEVFPCCIGIIGRITEDGVIRSHFASSLTCWDPCLMAVDECCSSADGGQYNSILIAILGLMFNLSLEVTSAIKERGIAISTQCLSLLCCQDGIVLTRLVGILSRVLPQCTAAVGLSVQQGIVKKLIKMLKAGGQKTSMYAVKVLAVCTKEDIQACKDVIKYDKRFSTLVNLLRSEDEIIVANTALSLGCCFAVPGSASSLLQSDILKLLLTHAGGDAKKSSVQQNAAIALAKLCSAEPRYLVQLRELHGIEILNSCMKYIK
ncbi:PREDICTED: tetratricopeptide repeat protein 12 [Nanorana parkeri]|uniref:tetratricopeptide repeat protein 12 n=1 Tax=Nanorana parkeri TaxID=125878 RepID=UPI000854C45E|nr:PREDICTED: tetratricopeptide repeat protein 12 [Nanorana parkeri]